jgi:DNA-repair protein complementing XP-A cells
MTLTEEQKERIRKNRERALQIQRERKLKLQKEREKKEQQQQQQQHQEAPDNKKRTTTAPPPPSSSSPSTTSPTKKQKQEDNNRVDEIEPFEEGASEFVTKREAMNIYCLPVGTLNVCHVEERDNPHNPKWKPMKLYGRSEVRRRAHERYGGMDGLIAERTKRRQRKLHKDMEEAQNIFK